MSGIDGGSRSFPSWCPWCPWWSISESTQRAPGAEVAAHAVDAAAGWRGGGTDEEARVGGRVGIEAGDRAGEELEQIGHAAGDGAADVVGIVALEIGRAGSVARQNEVAEAGREAFDLALDGV